MLLAILLVLLDILDTSTGLTTYATLTIGVSSSAGSHNSYETDILCYGSYVIRFNCQCRTRAYVISTGSSILNCHIKFDN